MPVKKEMDYVLASNTMPNSKIIVLTWLDSLKIKAISFGSPAGMTEFNTVMRPDISWDFDNSVTAVIKPYFTSPGLNHTNPCKININ